jgi:hypothetical protein
MHACRACLCVFMFWGCIKYDTANCKINGNRSDGVPVVMLYKAAVGNRWKFPFILQVAVLRMYMCVYIYIYICVCIYVCMYTYVLCIYIRHSKLISFSSWLSIHVCTCIVFNCSGHTPLVTHSMRSARALFSAIQVVRDLARMHDTDICHTNVSAYGTDMSH